MEKLTRYLFELFEGFVAGFAISNLSWLASVVTVTTTAEHELETGQSVTISGANPVGYNGKFVIIVIDVNTFTYGLVSDPGAYIETAVYIVAPREIFQIVYDGKPRAYPDSEKAALYVEPGLTQIERNGTSDKHKMTCSVGVIVPSKMFYNTASNNKVAIKRKLQEIVAKTDANNKYNIESINGIIMEKSCYIDPVTKIPIADDVNVVSNAYGELGEDSPIAYTCLIAIEGSINIFRC